MDNASKWTESFACGLAVLPVVIGVGTDSFDAFAITLGIMLVAFIAVTIGASVVEERQEKK